MATRRLIRIDGVLKIVPVCRAEWYNRIRRGEAPASVPIGPRAVAWVESEVQEYVDGLIAGRDEYPQRAVTRKNEKGKFVEQGAA